MPTTTNIHTERALEGECPSSLISAAGTGQRDTGALEVAA